MGKLIEKYRCIFEPSKKKVEKITESELKRFLCDLPECEKYIAEWAMKEGSVTNWFLNDKYMDWCTKFYKKWCGPEKGNQEKLQRAFTYRANKLVKLGFLKTCVRTGLSEASYFDFGTRTITTWDYKYT